MHLFAEEESGSISALTRNPAALLALFMGIDAGDNGRYDDAGEYYAQALHLDPHLDLAKESLEELNTLGLLKKTTQRRRMLRQMREETSFSTTLNPPLPISRIPQPAGVVKSNNTRINQDLIDTPTIGASPNGLDGQSNGNAGSSGN